MVFKKKVIELLKNVLKGVDIENLIEIPPEEQFGDYSLPCYKLSKLFKKKPDQIAAELCKKLKPNKYIKEIKTIGPYLNFYFNEEKIVEFVLKKIQKERDFYGSSEEGNGKKIVIDFSSPNIAKPFSIAHLRSTVIGNSLYQIFRFLGYKCISINHIGDWGTQFGKLIVAYKLWGNKNELEKNPISHLLQLYVKFHKEAEKNKELENLAREEFKNLELGKKENIELWKKFTKLSLKEFKKVYERLGIDFNRYVGESFYESLNEKTLDLLRKKKLVERSEGALVVNLDKFDMPPCILKKSDGATTYELRDISAAIYRYKKYSFDEMLYVVDTRQSLHFRQVFKVLELCGFKWAKKCKHVEFGLMKFPSGVMATRKGKVVILEDVLDKAKELILKIIKEKNPKLKNKEKIADQVSIGAIIFWDLLHDRIKDIVFEWDKVLDFEGETGPYVQYAHSRACSILKKAKLKVEELKLTKDCFALLNKKEEIKLVKLLGEFGFVIKESAIHYKPSILARYLIEVAQAFNEFYHSCPCLKEKNENLKKLRLLLVFASKQVLSNGLRLLGIKAPESM